MPAGSPQANPSAQESGGERLRRVEAGGDNEKRIARKMRLGVHPRAPRPIVASTRAPSVICRLARTPAINSQRCADILCRRQMTAYDDARMQLHPVLFPYTSSLYPPTANTSPSLILASIIPTIVSKKQLQASCEA
eukprot:1960717-Pyramimonas_sp.AAC.1